MKTALRRHVALLLLVSFGGGVGPATGVRPCPVHPGGHAGHDGSGTSPAGSAASHDHEGRDAASHDHGGHHAPVSHGDAGEDAGRDGSGGHPCDCLGLCLACCADPSSAPPLLSAGPAVPAGGSAVARSDAVIADPTVHLIPEAIPPPA